MRTALHPTLEIRAAEAPRAGPARRGPARILCIATAAAAAHAALVAAWLLPRQAAFGWDPAHHAMWGLTIYHDLTRGNWISFAFDTYRQVYWPFLHSWLIAGAMLVLGPTATAARIVSLAAHAFTAVALAVLAWRGAPRARGLAATVACGLWLSAAAYLRRFGAEAFTESAAIAATAATFVVLARAMRRRSPALWSAAGALTMGTYLTKTDYGIVLGLATAAAWALDARARPASPSLRLAGAWLLPVAVLGLLWFAYPPKLGATIAALVNRPQGPEVLSLDGILYHVRQLAVWSDGPWTFALVAAAFVASVRGTRPVWVRAVVAYVAIALLLHTLSQTKDAKHIVKVLPWTFLLAGLQASRLWVWLGSRRGGTAWRAALAAALAGLAVVRLAGLAAELRRDAGRGTEPIAAALVQRLEPERSHAVVGEFPALSPHLVNWTLLAGGPALALRPDPFTKKADYGKEWLDREVGRLAAELPALRLLERGPPSASIEIRRPWSRRRPGAPAPPDSILDELLADPAPARVLVLALEEGSRFGPVDPFLHDGRAFLPELARHPYACAERVRFAGAGVQLLVFDRARRPPPRPADAAAPSGPACAREG